MNLFRMLGLALLLSCGSALARDAAPATSRPVPLLWKACDADNCVYLLGSFHVLKASDYPLSNDVDAALAKSTKVVFEISPTEMQDKNAAAMALFKSGFRMDSTTLDNDLTPKQQAKFAAWAKKHEAELAKSGLSPEMLRRFKPWFVAIMITQLEYQAAGMSPEFGLDEHMSKAASDGGKQTLGLETVAEQVQFLSGLSQKDQVQMLEESLDDDGSTAGEIETLHKAWRAGDADALWNDMGLKMRDHYPDAYRAIDADRNAHWLPRLASMIDAPGEKDTLVVVGSLHLLGPDGLVEGLKARGYKVERVCSACGVKATR
ncbi:TraB/GumN family protein [Solilutibacter silvestris]|uniref:TraB/GumN family protein n=1 Tax=Solilutibacter silvestris TaxID=1645665 RepID=UPI003D327E55